MKKGIFLSMIGLMALCVELRLNGIELVPDIVGVVVFAIGLVMLRQHFPQFAKPLIASGVFAALSAISMVTSFGDTAATTISINPILTSDALALARLAALVGMLWFFCDAVFKTLSDQGLHELADHARQRRTMFVVVWIGLHLALAFAVVFNILFIPIVLFAELWFAWWLTAPLRGMLAFQAASS
jgi:hypothetical protein